MVPKCFSCGEDLIWQNDYDTEDVAPDTEYLIVSMYQCPNEECKAWYEMYHGLKEQKLN